MRLALVIATSLLTGAAAAAQDQPTPDRPSDHHDQGGRGDSERRDAQRAWLVRQLEESRNEQARLESMLAKLDAGEPLPEFRRPGRGDRDGEGRDGRPGAQRAAEGPAPSIEERVRLVAQFAREHFPEFAERLESEHRDDPAAARRIAARFWPRIVELKEIEKSDPELFAVEIDRLRNSHAIMALLHRARRAAPADDAARERMIAHLRQLAERSFELRLEAIRLRLASLRESVRETELELQERRAERERSVEEHVERLLRFIDRDDSKDGRSRREGRRSPPGGG